MKPIERLQHFYIKHIKKWMFCPVSHEKLHISKDGKVWVCEHCEYVIADKDFTDDFVFWFCDKCNSYLNIQEGFNRKAVTWKCKKCGYVSALVDDNLI